MTHSPVAKQLAVLLALSCFVGTASAQEPVKIATVDLLRVFDSYWKTKLSNDQLKERGADFDKARIGMIDDLNLLREEYNRLNASAQDPANSDEKRSGDLKKAQEKLTEFKRLEQQVIDFNKNAQKTLGDQTRRLRKGRLEEIQEVINAKARELGYDLAIDSSQDVLLPRTPNVLYTNLKNDITEIVLAELNSDSPENPEPTTPTEPSPTTIPERQQVPAPESDESPIPPPGTRTPPPDNYPEPPEELDPFVVPAMVDDIYKIPIAHATTMVGYYMTTEDKPMIFLSEPGEGQVHSFKPNPTILPLLDDGRWLFIDYPGSAVGCVYAALVTRIREPKTVDMELPVKWLQKNFPDFSQNAVPYWDGFCAPTAFGNVAWVLGEKYPNLDPARIFDLDEGATPSLKANMLVGGIKAIPHPDSLAALMMTTKLNYSFGSIVEGFKKHLDRDDTSEWDLIKPTQLLKSASLLENLRRESSLGSGIVLCLRWGNPAMEAEDKGGALVVVYERSSAQEVDETKPPEPKDETKPLGIFYVFGVIILAAAAVGLFVILTRGR